MTLERLQSFSCKQFLDYSGTMRHASIQYDSGEWDELSVGEPLSNQTTNPYIVPMLPIEVHCHGIGQSDFSQFETLDLEQLNNIARKEGIYCYPSIFLAHHKLDAFVSFMKKYAEARENNKLPYLPGISLEGPLLASFGGTPPDCSWLPSQREWEKLARCGKLGLEYMVLSPDATLKGANLAEKWTASSMPVDEVAALFLENNVRLSLGHFQRSSPVESAKCILSVLQVAKDHKCSRYDIMTDHLFNDMPLNFKHAWRTSEEKTSRREGIQKLQLDKWNMNNLPEMVGEVPATLIQAASEGLLTICLNFDGEHVDLEVCRKLMELVGPQSVMAMTDRTEVNCLGSQKLERKEGINLWYQSQGIVSAGMSNMDKQMSNLRTIGLSEPSIWQSAALTPSRAFGHMPRYDRYQRPSGFCYVSSTRERQYIEISKSLAIADENMVS